MPLASLSTSIICIPDKFLAYISDIYFPYMSLFKSEHLKRSIPLYQHLFFFSWSWNFSNQYLTVN